MRVYEVRPGDSPASIAAEHAGCPKCARDLIGVNAHKSVVVHPNGFKTFRDLTVHERLNLPDKWFDGSLDGRPPAYFAALPYADGVTPSMLGDAAAGVLGDYATLDTAAVAVGALPAMPDPMFVAAVGPAAAEIDSSVSETFNGSNPAAATLAQQVRTATDWARQRNADLSAALLNSDTTGAASARFDAQTALTTALGAARITLQVFYGSSTTPAPAPTPSPDPATGFPTAIAAAAQAVATAMSADPGYCESISQTGSAVNAAVHAFKTAWNSANPSSPVPVNTGNYEQATADVLTRVLGTAPPACATRAPAPAPSPQPVIVPPQPEPEGLSTGEIAGIALAGAGVVGGAVYLATRSSTRRRRRR